MQDARHVFINEYIDALILHNYGVNDGSHDQWCDIKPEPLTGKAIPFPLDFYCLEWPQEILNINLQIGSAQDQYSDV